MGFALTRVTLTSSLGPAAARGPCFVAPASGRRVSPSGRRGLVCWRPPAPAHNAINLPLPRSHPLNCHQAPQVPRLGTDCILQGLKTSLTHPWHFTGTRGSQPAPLTLPEGIPGIPSCTSSLLCLHGSGRTRQDEEFASRGLKNSTTPVTAGGVSPGLAPAGQGLRTSTGAPSQPRATEPRPFAPCLVQH